MMAFLHLNIDIKNHIGVVTIEKLDLPLLTIYKNGEHSMMDDVWFETFINL
jgi:hypothetical protein